MSSFSTETRVGIEGTEAWVLSARDIAKVLNLVFKNRYGEIWLFNNDLEFFSNENLFKSVYLQEIMRSLGKRVSTVKIFVEENQEEEIFSNKCAWLTERFNGLSQFIADNNLRNVPRFLFGRMSELRRHEQLKVFFGPKGIPARHTWVFYLHGSSLSGSRQHGLALYRPTEFPFCKEDSPLVMSWHLSDSRILSDADKKSFNTCFTRSDFFTELFPTSLSGKDSIEPESDTDVRYEGVAFGEPTDVLVLTPADDEMAYLRAIFGKRLHPLVTPGENGGYSIRTHNGLSVILSKIGEGNIAAGVATSRLLDIFHPKKVILVGVAGAVVPRGRHSWTIGDVVIGQSVIDYEWGDVVEQKASLIRRKKESWSFLPKTDIKTVYGGEDARRALYAQACTLASDGWKLSAEKVKEELGRVLGGDELVAARTAVDHVMRRDVVAHAGLVGSGSKIVASRKYVKDVVDCKSAAINAFETEGCGVMHACEGRADCVVIRGIMDFVDGESRHDKWRKSFRHIAKIASGSFVKRILDTM